MGLDLIVLGLLAAFMVAALMVYERYGLRLGGTLVLPLLLLYAIQSFAVIPMFVLAAAATYLIGEATHRTTLLYGRRLFVVYLLTSLVVSYGLAWGTGLLTHGRMLLLLPGIFAFNLHREGRPIRGSLAFMGSLALVTVLALVVVSAVQGTPAFAQALPLPFPDAMPTGTGELVCGTVVVAGAAVGEPIFDCAE